jgi:hypothetical protein
MKYSTDGSGFPSIDLSFQALDAAGSTSDFTPAATPLQISFPVSRPAEYKLYYGFDPSTLLGQVTPSANDVIMSAQGAYSALYISNETSSGFFKSLT